MGQFVTNGALLQCSFGMAPTPLTVVGLRPFNANMPMANIMDFAPMLNIKPFGMCKSLTNPTVASATAAAMGTLTPMPCIPVISAPWSPAGQAKICGFGALLNNAKCTCAYGGQISITFAGNTGTDTGK